MKEVVIRKAEAEDVPQLVELAVEMVVHSISPLRNVDPAFVQEFRRRDLLALNEAITRPDFGVFLAFDKASGLFLGHVIVQAGYMESSTGEAQGWVFDLSVRQDHWGSGVAQQLMERAEAFSLEQGYDFIGLGVTTGNHRAVHFYEKLGYVEERKRMLKHLGKATDA